MPRIRTLKPEMWLSPQVMNLTHSARLLFIGLITQADDEGRGCADPRRLKASIFPGDDCTVAQVEAWLADVVRQRLARHYHDDEHGAIYELPTWTEHQSIDRAKPSRYPPSSKCRRSIDEPSPKDREGSRIEDLGSRIEEGNKTRAKDRAVDDSAAKAAKPEPPEPDAPAGLDPVAWQRWRDYRVKIRRPLKPVSIPAAQRELSAFGCNQAAVVEQSIANGWQGLFELKRTNGAATSTGPPTRRRTADELEAEAIAAGVDPYAQH